MKVSSEVNGNKDRVQKAQQRTKTKLFPLLVLSLSIFFYEPVFISSASSFSGISDVSFFSSLFSSVSLFSLSKAWAAPADVAAASANTGAAADTAARGAATDSATAAAVNSVSLSEAWEISLKHLESLPIAKARLNQMEAKEDQARSKFLPNLSLSANYLQQEGDSARNANLAFPGSSYTRLNLSQSLYEGGRDKASLAYSQSNKKMQEFNLEMSKLSTYSKLAQAFYLVLAGEQDLQNTQKTLSLANERLQEINHRVKLGRSRKIDLIAAKAQLSVLESQLKAAEVEVNTARDQFALLTGLASTTKLILKKETTLTPKDFDFYKARLKDRPDLKALKAGGEASQNNIQMMRSAHFPSLDLLGSYYLNHENTLKANNQWEASLNFSLPLYSGGLMSAQVREASERANEMDLQFKEQLRLAESEIRIFYNNLISAQNQLKPLEVALKLTEENFKEQEKNYRFGQATNLDVIQALNSFQDTKRSFDRTRFQAISNWAQLNIQTEQLDDL